MATKRQRSDDEDDHRPFHLLAQDWNRGFTLYKLDLHDFDADPDSDDDSVELDAKALHLPRRAVVVRLAGHRTQQFVAAGTKIYDFHRSSKDGANLVFDIKTPGVTAVPPFQGPKSFAAFWAVGGSTVYALDCGLDAERHRCFEKLSREPLPGYGQWRWESLPAPPFHPGHVVSQALHPDGSTFFLSLDKSAGTFSYDTKRRAWARHGRSWTLPFDGEAHYVGGEVDAWVGLCSRRKGRLVACQVISHRPSDDDDDDCGRELEPEACKCKTGKDVLYLRSKWEQRHLGASLTYLGNAEFCLQELLTQKGYDFSMATGVKVPLLLRLVTFRVEYSGDVEQLCAVNRRARIYKLSRDVSEYTPIAFRM